MISLARWRGERPRRSASPRSVTTTWTSCSVWSTCETMGTMVEIVPFCAVEGAMKMERYPLRGEVARAADAVLDARAHHVCRVDVAVDVAYDHGVHGDHAQAADQLGVVGNLLRPQHDAFAIALHVGVDFCQHLGTEREGCSRGAG